MTCRLNSRTAVVGSPPSDTTSVSSYAAADRTTLPVASLPLDMTREQLQHASESLRQASEAAEDEDLQSRLYDHSNQLAELANADQGPDHGRLARHLNALEEMKADAGEDVAAAIDDAREAITEYRKTVEGI